jgi:cell shape-determining protein MreD
LRAARIINLVGVSALALIVTGALLLPLPGQGQELAVVMGPLLFLASLVGFGIATAFPLWFGRRNFSRGDFVAGSILGGALWGAAFLLVAALAELH